MDVQYATLSGSGRSEAAHGFTPVWRHRTVVGTNARKAGSRRGTHSPGLRRVKALGSQTHALREARSYATNDSAGSRGLSQISSAEGRELAGTFPFLWDCSAANAPRSSRSRPRPPA